MKGRLDRVITGAGRWGVAFGGLNGDGDIKMVSTPQSARQVCMDALREQLGTEVPEGALIRGQWVTKAEARLLLERAEADANAWRDQVDGECVEIAVEIPNLTTLRIALFKCEFHAGGPAYGHAVLDSRVADNRWWIPLAVRVPRDYPRYVKATEPTSKGRR